MYKNLAAYFLKCLNKQIEKLKEYEKQEKELKDIQDLLAYASNVDINFDEIKDLITQINRKELDNVIPTLDLINNLRIIINKIELDIENIDISNLKNLLDSAHISKEEQDKIFDILSTIKAVYGFIKNPNFGDKEFKNMILEKRYSVLNDLNVIVVTLSSQVKDIVQNFCNSVLIRKMARTSFSKKDSEQIISKFERYMSLFNEKGIEMHFSSSDEMSNFFEEIRYSDLRDEEKLSLILEFSKYNVDYYNKLIEIRNLNIQKRVMKNAADIIESMEKIVSVAPQKQSLPVQEEDKTKESKSVLSDENSEIVFQVKQAIEKYFTAENYDYDFLEMFRDDCITSREGYYYAGNKLNWSVIATDVKYILEPNLENHTKEVLGIFKYILGVIKSYESKKQETDQKVSKIKSIIDRISDIINSRKGALKYYENLSNQLPYLDSVCNYIRQKDYESAKHSLPSKDIPLSFFEYMVILQDLMKLNADINDEVDLIAADDEFYDQIIGEIESLLQLESVHRNSFDEYFNSLYAGGQASEHVDYGDIKNIVYYMFDDFSALDEEQRAELQEATKNLLNARWYEIKDNKHFKEDLFKKKPNGERVYYKDEGLDACRIWAKPGTRTGIIKINVCEENQKKIFKRYGLARMNTVILVIGVIHALGQDHDEYDSLTGFIDKNMNRINEIIKIFGNPNSDEKEMLDIVDSALKASNKIAKGDFSGKQIG